MSTPEVALISIGTELTQGFTLNKNAHWLSNECRQLGFKIAYHLALPDDASYWNKTFKMLKEANVSIVIITGGLGPTADDKTRELIAETFGKPLVYNVNCEEKIKAWFQKRNLTYIETNHIQACFPEGSIILENPVGSAPGFQIDEGDLHLFCLPGVPSEMKKMFQVHLVPWLQSISTTTWYHQDLRLFGLSESALEALLRTFEFENGVYWSSLPMIDCLLFRLYTSKSKEALTKARDQFVNSLGDKADQILISDNGENLIQVIMTLLKEKNQFLGVAESCTGGLLASEIVKESGSSLVFKGGVVAYQNEIKTKILHVPEEILKTEGAVSEATVLSMAEHTLNVLNCDWGIATSGIAGPTGGTKEKPVGLVWMAIASKQQKIAFSEIFLGNRGEIQMKSVYKVLNRLRLSILEQKNTCSKVQ
ncbi:MAG TPA: CinA family nicotinamide mononucleotide deamidase-related protein [Fibrobacteraceae bacterium]|nr:CinA family nicotinamide mononucleotide deamidase-related protein [Fibrobacteraceae bacterium]